MSFFKYHNYNVENVVVNTIITQNDFVLHVGTIENSGLLLLLDSSGNIVWNFSYNNEKDQRITFYKAIKFEDGYIIAGSTKFSGEKLEIPSLLKINSNGEVVWYKEFPNFFIYESIYLDCYEEAGLIYLTFYDYNSEKSILLLLNSESNIVFCRYLQNKETSNLFMVSCLRADLNNGRILICGNELLNDRLTGVYLVLGLEGDLQNSHYTYSYGEENITLYNIYSTADKIYLSGYISQKPIMLVADEYLACVYHFNENIKTDLVFGPDFFYIVDAENKVILSDYSFSLQWRKSYDVTNIVIDQIPGEEIVFHGISNGINYSGLGSYLLQNCKSTNTAVPEFTYIEYSPEENSYTFEDYDYSEEYIEIKPEEVDYYSDDVCGEGGGTSIPISSYDGLQTPNFYVQAVGSKGIDSTKGIHLRWAFGGSLGENHLAKGKLSNAIVNYNKPNDFVKIYRAPYNKVIFNLDFSIAPSLIDDNQKLWVYKFNNNTRIIYIYFRNAQVYNQVRQSNNPFINPLVFIEKYGNEIIEIQCKTDLFFAAQIVSNINTSSSLQIECLSVKELANVSQQHLTYRNTFNSNDLSNTYFNAENGRCIRFKPSNLLVTAVRFEFYTDFINSANEQSAWKELGGYGLTMDNDEAFSYLDPLPAVNPVDKKWLRYNDNAFVNIENYKNKWEHSSQGPLDRDIKSVIDAYVKLSDNQNNPKAFETLNINFTPSNNDPAISISNNDPNPGQTQISNLEILNIAALDYHVARMLGLGTLDIGPDVLGRKFMYLAEYFTNNNLDINDQHKDFQLLSLSLPVSTEIERLSLPINLWKLEKGMGGNSPHSSNLYNNEGYSHDGKYRYISIFNHALLEFEVNPSFFSSSLKFDASAYTNPVYAGLEHRLVEPGQVDNFIWKKPELTHDSNYMNYDTSANANNSFETLPIQIPHANTPMYMHRQEKTGTYFYKGYGYNWFSRAQYGSTELSILTEIKPFNKLLPPSGINAFNIQKEYPLTFTTQTEQNRLQAIPQGSDKTLVRLNFDYHIYQDEIGYSIPFDSPLSNNDYINDPNSLFPDDKEVFADDVEIYFRNSTPRIISAQIYDIQDDQNNQLLTVIKTKNYIVPSTGSPNASSPSITPTTLYSMFPQGTTALDFVGGIFLYDGESYIIHQISQGTLGLEFTVFKKEPSSAIIAGTTPVINQTSLTSPVLNPSTEGLFNATENMQNTQTWGSQNPNSLKIKIGNNDWSIHREIINLPQSGGTSQRFLEKSRGFWKYAKVEKYFEEVDKYQNSQGIVITYPNLQHPDTLLAHRGIYKITFTGFKLSQHPQFSADSHSVEWFNGVVRLFTNETYDTNGEPTDSRSIFKVVRTENIGNNQDLILYIYDENFFIEEDNNHNPIFLEQSQNPVPLIPTDPEIGNNVLVNYYPSYKVYLYKNISNNLTQDALLPTGDDDVKYSVFGLKSVDNDNYDLQGNKYKSKFSFPIVLFVRKIIEPLQPKQPIGSKYATRPDKFGKSTYSFLTEYLQKPYSVQFFRTNNTLLLSALYHPDKIKSIRENLDLLGGQDEVFFNNRWINFTDIDMFTNGISTVFETFPDVGDFKYALPLPDSEEFFKAINAFIHEHNLHFNLTSGDNYYSVPLSDTQRGNVTFNTEIIKEIPNVSDKLLFGHFIKEAIFNCFMPLTEIPIIYQHIKPLNLSSQNGHRPQNKKQNIRDLHGYMLPATDSLFDMAPMAAIYSQNPHTTLFTDFTIDGASDNFYFYAARELGNQMKMGEFSTFAGPIKLVNTNPAEPPKILSLLPVLENKTLGIKSKIRVEINPYPDVQKINKISLYRSSNRLDAESILSMTHIKTFDISDIEIDSVNGSWIIYDDFEDLDVIPFGDLLFYRVIVSRKVEYSNTDYLVNPPTTQVIVEQAPSLPSKITLSTLVETSNPPTPELKYNAEPVTGDLVSSVILNWEQVCYKGKYHLYKLSNQGNWKEIARIETQKDDLSKGTLFLFQNDSWIQIPNADVYITDNSFFLPLNDLNLEPLAIKNDDGSILYHHFKVIAENTSGMFSTEEKILTIYKEDTWSDIGGISSDGIDGMILQGTFIIRP